MTPYYQDGLVTLYQGDMRDVAPQLQGITAIVTDPPYGLGEWFQDGNQVLIPTMFDVVFPDLYKFVVQGLDNHEFFIPRNRSTLLRHMDRTVWEKPGVSMPESSIDFNDRVVFWDEEVKDAEILPSAVVSRRVLVEKLNAHAFQGTPYFFFNLRPCRNAAFSDSARCGVAELGNGRLRVPIVIPLDSCLAGFLRGCLPREQGFLAYLVGLLNNAPAYPRGSPFVMTESGAEMRAILSLDLARGSLEFLPAYGAEQLDFVFELRCTQQVGTSARTGCLPSEFQPSGFRLVDDSADRAFPLCLHKKMIAHIEKKRSGFMSKDWDHGVPGEPFWHLLRDACVPGAPLLAFGGTRTFHRLVCAIEDAGWELRDTLGWVYSSGFPKSQNISLALDKLSGSMSHRSTKFNHAGGKGKSGGYGMAYDDHITDAAKQWSGYGSALSPAWEPVTLARKPLEGTLAQNVTQHGVGGLNIDGCRIPADDIRSGGFGRGRPPWRKGHIGKNSQHIDSTTKGRWPKNILHDGSAEVEALFPYTTSGLRTPEHADNGKGKGRYGDFSGGPRAQAYGGDSGSASRFFYTAKASPAEREAYNDHPTVKPLALMTYLVRLIMQPQRNLILDPFCGSGSTLVAAKSLGLRCIGIDQDAHALDITIERLRQEVLPFGGDGA